MLPEKAPDDQTHSGSSLPQASRHARADELLLSLARAIGRRRGVDDVIRACQVDLDDNKH
jgi:hypothetical protein